MIGYLRMSILWHFDTIRQEFKHHLEVIQSVLGLKKGTSCNSLSLTGLTRTLGLIRKRNNKVTRVPPQIK